MENRYIHYGIVLGLIAAISAGILGVVNKFTNIVIQENSLKIVNEARKQVLPSADSFKQDELKEIDGIQYVPAYDGNSELIGYVASVSSPGYGGPIDFVVGIDKEANITGLSVIANSETPGLGAKISNPEWQANWIGRNSSYEFNKSVDAFAGATISPKAVYDGVIRALNTYEKEVNK